MSKQRKVVFLAAYLTPDARDALKEWYASKVGELLPKEYAHHMTIKFKPGVDDLQLHPEGTKVELRVVGYASNDWVQAVVVEGYPSANACPHITVATNNSPPKMANELLVDGYTRAEGPTLGAYVLAYRGGGK